MKKILIISLFTLLLTGSWGYAAIADPSPRIITKEYHSLNLSFKQRYRILEIRQAFEKETLSLRHKLQKYRLDLKRLKSTRTYNRRLIRAKKRQITYLRGKIAAKARRMKRRIRRVLTDEQIFILSELSGEREPKHQEKLHFELNQTDRTIEEDENNDHFLLEILLTIDDED